MGSGGSVPLSATRQNASAVFEQEEPQEEQSNGPTDSQGPSPYATLRREDWWRQRPSAPSLPEANSSIQGSCEGGNGPQTHQETLFAYASQMTGWPSGVGSNLGSSRSEVTELSRTVSCLAAANQQLAAAHGAALSHLEALYRDLRTARLSKDCEKDFPEEDVCSADQSTRRTVRGDEEERNEKRLTQYYVARLESLLAVKRDDEISDRRSSRRSQASHTEETVREDDFNGELDRLPNGIEEQNSEQEKARLRKALARIDELEDTLRNERLKNADGETNRSSTIPKSTTMEKEVQCDEAEDIDNQELKNQLEVQKQRIERLEDQCKVSTVEREKLESKLHEREEEVNKLVNDLEFSNTKRINLEQELHRTIMDKDQVKISEGQKSARLRAQLAEEVGDKKKQIKALEEALEEIQRLKLAVKSEKRESSKSLEEEAAALVEESCSETTAVLENAYESEDVVCAGRATNMEEFKKELTLKREARQRAIAAVSSEMDRLRRELEAEKEAHSETAKMLDLVKSGGATASGESSSSEVPSESAEDEGRLKMLRIELQEEKEAHQETLRRITAQQIADTLKVSDEIKSFVRFEAEKLEDLRYHLERDTEKHERQISEVKEAVSGARVVLAVREKQVNQLKDQLAQIIARLDVTNYTIIFDDARAEFDHQLENLRNLKTLFKVRLKVLIGLKEHTTKELAKTKENLDISQKKLKTLEEDLEKSEEKVDIQDTEISNLESQLGLTKADCRDLENQMSVINSLFTQMLLSASSADMDLDRLTRLLQENHDLISDMAREEGTEAAALPKLLLDLVEQVEGRSSSTKRDAGEENEADIQEENIAHNLPKVWRVLLELLSCHAVDVPSPSASALSAPDSCYKSVDTPTGPQLVISVSKTYIRLKELILEKKHLEKEMTRMKQLNTHLESKLGEQEKRLSTVSSELSKTWNIVGRMQAQHQQLHTHEKILRYELQQKRKMLQELKQELEYCREKWESARQKNTNTELEWKSLRREFAARKALAVRDSLNNSGESGFSDERGDESDEEDEGRAERIRISPRRRTRKESPRVPSPDTESEQPTDTEISESKTCSSETLGQRTPTPETETEIDAEMVDGDSVSSDPRPATPEPDCTPETEILDPLDRALTNVIQSLIKIDTVSNTSSASTSRESLALPSTSSAGLKDSSTSVAGSGEISKRRGSCRREAREWSPHSEPWSSSKADIKLPSLSFKKSCKFEEDAKMGKNESKRSSVDSSSDSDSRGVEESFSTGIEDLPHREKSDSRIDLNKTGENSDGEDQPNLTNSSSTAVSVFSIGPYPTSKSPSPVKTVQFSEPLILGPAGSPICGTSSTSISSNDLKTEEVKEENECSKDSESSKSLETENRPCSSDEDIAKPGISEPAITEDPKRSNSEVCTEEENDKNETPSSLPHPSTSALNSSAEETPKPKASRSPEEVLAARAARLKRLEEQADWLMKKMNATSQRGSALSSRLEELHEVYGEPPAPPPLPDVLPTLRLETNYEPDERLEGDQEISEEEKEEEEEETISASRGEEEEEEEDAAFKESEMHTDADESPPDNAP